VVSTMKLSVMLVSLSALGCATHPVTPRSGPPSSPPPPLLACSPPSWEGPVTFTISCQNAIPPKSAEGTVPTPALVNASYATLLAESAYFCIDRAELDAAAHVPWRHSLHHPLANGMSKATTLRKVMA
jgi:hypothetical protein